jgi:molybdenum cofactor biosynthesis protein B
MQSVQSVSVHIAVLAVGKDAAPTQTVGELAAKAGHQIVARATVTDTQPAIRNQLTKWIEDPNIDVIIVSGGIESENASAAVKPLISHTLPGFTDLFRYLAFQEIGASAMLSNAEAAQCGVTFVFVLPACRRVAAFRGDKGRRHRRAAQLERFARAPCLGDSADRLGLARRQFLRAGPGRAPCGAAVDARCGDRVAVGDRQRSGAGGDIPAAGRDSGLGPVA